MIDHGTTQTSDVATLVRELRATLDQIGDALVNGALDDLIATESRLSGLAGGLSHIFADETIAPAPRSEVDAALAALRRCQRLGSSFTEMGMSWLDVDQINGYTRSGRSHAASSSPRARNTIETRA